MIHKNGKIDKYLATLPDNRRESLRQLRVLVARALPEAHELIAYNMPAVAVTDGDIVCSYKSQKNYISLYMDVELVEKHKDELAGLDCGKSCIRFKRFEQLPQDVIKKILVETAVKQTAAQQ
ncbi:MAG: DUF1801 domain-containing protein [Chloroflexi bacterium]|nr:DUF1801 domain-containing protein [Chloroflexota bacterium]